MKTFDSDAHWKYTGASWTNSDEEYYSRYQNEINKVGDSYEFMKKCDPSDSNNPRCSVWRIVFPSNADGIDDIFHVKERFSLNFSTLKLG